MSTDLQRLIREEAEHAEQNMDAEPGPADRPTRPGHDRAKILSVRLNAEEMERLSSAAKGAGVGPSTLARGMILAKLDEGAGVHPEAPLTDLAERLERAVARLESAPRIMGKA